MPKVFRRYGRLARRGILNTGITGGSIEEDEVKEETPTQTEFHNGLIVQKPLQQMYGQQIKGLNMRTNNNVIKTFSTPSSKQVRIPLSADSINPQNSSAIAHLGKAIGASKSLVKNVSLMKGNGLLQGKNNIKLVL